jgi:REP element-mobilizing transposase RayT
LLRYVRRDYKSGTGNADARYANNAGAVFSFKHHIVWCPKYPPSGMTHHVENRLAVVHEAAALRGMKVHGLAVMAHHVHLLIETDCGPQL